LFCKLKHNKAYKAEEYKSKIPVLYLW